MARILLVEENLRSRFGHQFEYALCLQTAAGKCGHELSVAAHAEADESVQMQGIYPILTHGRLSRQKSSRSGLFKQIDFLVNNYYCYSDLFRFLKKFGGYDCLLFPTASHYQLLAIWALLFLHPRLARRAVVFFVQQPTYWQEGDEAPKPERTAWLVRLQLRLLRTMLRNRRAVIAVETPIAQQEYQALTGENVHLWGHPVEVQRVGGRHSPGKIVFSSFGFARYEKGSDIWVEAVNRCLHDSRFDECIFVIQWTGDCTMPDGTCRGLPDSLRDDDRVRIINTALDHEAYAELISSSSAIVLPYRRNSYYGRLSRIAIEAAVAGIPLIVSEGTHAAEVMENQGAGVTMVNYSAAALVDAMAGFVSIRHELTSRATKQAPDAHSRNSPETFLKKMLAAFDPIRAS